MAKSKKINPKEALYSATAVRISTTKVRLLQDTRLQKRIKMNLETKSQLVDYIFGNPNTLNAGEPQENPFKEIQEQYESELQDYDAEFNGILMQIEKEKNGK